MANQLRRDAAQQELGRRHPYSTLYGGRLAVLAAAIVAGLALLAVADDATSVAVSSVQSWSLPRPPMWTAGAMVVIPVGLLWRRRRTGYRRPLRRRLRMRRY